MINLIAFSGGKDSTALVLWAKEQEMEFTPIFDDTRWEHPLTYAYIAEINAQVLGGQLVVLSSDKYEGFEDLVIKRKMVPGLKSRFCTQELKIFPMEKYIKSLDDEVTVFQGIRADESLARSKWPRREWCNAAGGYWMERPLFDWTAEQCFAIMKRHGVRPNPLYLLGAKRVGCWPCVMEGKASLRNQFIHSPELLERLEKLEALLPQPPVVDSPRTFFRSDYIPERFHSLRWVKDGRQMSAPSARDVYNYVMKQKLTQMDLIEAPSCMSIYNLCE